MATVASAFMMGDTVVFFEDDAVPAMEAPSDCSESRAPRTMGDIPLDDISDRDLSDGSGQSQWEALLGMPAQDVKSALDFPHSIVSFPGQNTSDPDQPAWIAERDIKDDRARNTAARRNATRRCAMTHTRRRVRSLRMK